MAFLFFFGGVMRYYYIKKREWTCKHARTYMCDNPLYNSGTLYFENGKGMLVIQLHFDERTKRMWWGPIDPWLIDDIYSQVNFFEVFNKIASEKNSRGIFPEIKIRKLMWELRMKPLKKEIWESI